jgi:hypothetical protein
VGNEETLTAQEPSDDRCEEGPDRGSKARVRTDREFGFHLNVIGFGGHSAGLRHKNFSRLQIHAKHGKGRVVSDLMIHFSSLQANLSDEREL